MFQQLFLLLLSLNLQAGPESTVVMLHASDGYRLVANPDRIKVANRYIEIGVEYEHAPQMLSAQEQQQLGRAGGQILRAWLQDKPDIFEVGAVIKTLSQFSQPVSDRLAEVLPDVFAFASKQYSTASDGPSGRVKKNSALVLLSDAAVLASRGHQARPLSKETIEAIQPHLQVLAYPSAQFLTITADVAGWGPVVKFLDQSVRLRAQSVELPDADRESLRTQIMATWLALDQNRHLLDALQKQQLRLILEKSRQELEAGLVAGPGLAGDLKPEISVTTMDSIKNNLRQLGHRRWIEVFNRAGGAHFSEEVQADVRRSFTQIEYAQMRRVLQLKSPSGDDLFKILSVRIPAHREAVAMDREMTDYLVFLTQDTDPKIRVEGLRVLGQVGKKDNRWDTIFLKSLSDPDPNVRYAAAVALGQLERRLSVQHAAQLKIVLTPLLKSFGAMAISPRERHFFFELKSALTSMAAGLHSVQTKSQRCSRL